MTLSELSEQNSTFPAILCSMHARAVSVTATMMVYKDLIHSKKDGSRMTSPPGPYGSGIGLQ
ncbi:hypothetical protein FDV58_34200 [Bradyrhizobium elkanii]|uniref:Uncharacterized protein n=1 Tax=Bradyrhizobium elkanii TaxID=29448 RepID=A0A4U6RI04_BRAEL|nr:hypothetical protein [Bradyrhizobium elkanii]TKV74057.1 hypothetical protein FDV58_34200 [Bradyrhizobium elkanii]